MKVKKYKHLSFEDRCVIEEFLNHNYNFTQINNLIGKENINKLNIKNNNFILT